MSVIFSRSDAYNTQYENVQEVGATLDTEANVDMPEIASSTVSQDANERYTAELLLTGTILTVVVSNLTAIMIALINKNNSTK